MTKFLFRDCVSELVSLSRLVLFLLVGLARPMDHGF